jgi:DNA polymerase III gamma/tau subunit
VSEELYKKLRPDDFGGVYGQEEAVSVLKEKLSSNKFPSAVLLSGPSGTGKTTLARICRLKLGCGDMDYSEVNAASTRGIELAREISGSVKMRPLSGEKRVWVLDEGHHMTNDCQTALLKVFEDTPRHAHFFVCTTHPNKLIPTIRNRCTEVKLSAISAEKILSLVKSACKSEKLKVTQEVLEKIVECAQGSARKALVLLDSVASLSSEDEMLDALSRPDGESLAIEVARHLMSPRPDWKTLSSIITRLADKEDDPETIRRIILGYATSVMLKTQGKQGHYAYLVICAFEDNFYDSGRAGLVRACWEVMQERNQK